MNMRNLLRVSFALCMKGSPAYVGVHGGKGATPWVKANTQAGHGGRLSEGSLCGYYCTVLGENPLQGIE